MIPDGAIHSLFELDYEPCVLFPKAVAQPKGKPVSTMAKQSAASPQAAKFRKMADTMQKEIERKRNCHANANPTRKRMQEQEHAHKEADSLEKQQLILRRMADAIDAQILPCCLAHVKTKDHILWLSYLVKPAEDYQRRRGLEFYWSWSDWKSRADCPATGIRTEAEFDRSRAWLLDALAGKKDSALAVERSLALEEKKLAMQEIPDFFPTPPAVVDMLLSLSNLPEEPGPGFAVLEPSAGSGTIAEAIRKAGMGKIEPICIEINYALREHLEKRGFNLLEITDFLEFTGLPEEFGYSRIIQNPPFSNGLDMKHVRHAYGLLRPGGRLVSVMATAWQFGSRKETVSFREWFGAVGGNIYELPANAFQKSLRPTGVSTCIVVIDK